MTDPNASNGRAIIGNDELRRYKAIEGAARALLGNYFITSDMNQILVPLPKYDALKKTLAPVDATSTSSTDELRRLHRIEAAAASFTRYANRERNSEHQSLAELAEFDRLIRVLTAALAPVDGEKGR